MDFSNQVIPVSESSGGAGSGYINAGRTRHRSAEAELGLDIDGLIDIPGNLSLNLNATFVESVFSGDRLVVYKISNGIPGDTVFMNVKGNRTPYAPGITAAGRLHYESPRGFGIRLAGHLTGRQYTDVLNTGNVNDWLLNDLNDPEYAYVQATANGHIGELPSFFGINASTWYDMAENLRLNLSVKNLMNERYISTRRPQGIRVGLPRIFIAGLHYKF